MAQYSRTYLFQLYILRKRATHSLPYPGARFYICSLSLYIIVYKGQLTSDQLWVYFEDLKVKLLLILVMKFLMYLFIPHALVLLKDFLLPLKYLEQSTYFFSLQTIWPIWPWFILDSPPIRSPAGSVLIHWGKISASAFRWVPNSAKNLTSPLTSCLGLEVVFILAVEWNWASPVSK